MPYAHGITREDVFTAAGEVFASGKNPTQAAVRARLGKGSFATISKYLQEWRSQQQPEADVETVEEEMPEQVRLLFRRAYSAIRTHVDSSAIAEQVALLETENETLRDALADHEKTKAELAGLRTAYRELLERMEAITRENERINKYLPDVEQVEKLRKGLETSLDNNKALQKQHSVAQKRIDELEQKLDEKYERVNELEEQQSQLQNQITELKIQANKAETLETQLKQSQSEVNNLTKRLGSKPKSKDQAGTIAGEVEYLPAEIWEMINREVEYRQSSAVNQAIAEPQPEPKSVAKRRSRKASTKQPDFETKAEAFIQDAVQGVKGGES